MSEIRIKRVYEAPSPGDGLRVFVDRLWARGVTKAAAQIDLWPKELTPSTKLRKWFHATGSRHAEFEQRYRAELESQLVSIQPTLDALQEHATITLVTATKDLARGHAAILKVFLSEKL